MSGAARTYQAPAVYTTPQSGTLDQRLAQLVEWISRANVQINALQSQVTDLQSRVTALEARP